MRHMIRAWRPGLQSFQIPGSMPQKSDPRRTHGAQAGPGSLYPLFCVSERKDAWMAAGYGVWAMETYLERFWTRLDWAAVWDAYARY